MAWSRRRSADSAAAPANERCWWYRRAGADPECLAQARMFQQRARVLRRCARGASYCVEKLLPRSEFSLIPKNFCKLPTAPEPLNATLAAQSLERQMKCEGVTFAERADLL